MKLAWIVLMLAFGTASPAAGLGTFIIKPIRLFIETDTQVLSHGSPYLEEWIQMHEAICEGKFDGVVHVGDLVDRPFDNQFANAEAAFATTLDKCDDTDLHAVPGNHDYDSYSSRGGPLTGLTKWLGWRAERPQRPDDVGQSEEVFVTSLGATWYIAGMTYVWDAANRAWLGEQLDALPNKSNVILVHHACANRAAIFSGSCVSFIAEHPNIRAVVSGHWLGLDRTGWNLVEVNGRAVLGVYGNFQHMGSSPLRHWGLTMTIDPVAASIEVSPFDPLTGATSYPANAHQQYDGRFVTASDPPKTFILGHP